MRKAVRFLLVCLFVLLPPVLTAAERFDGTWHTKVTCPPKGNTEGYTWTFDSVITNSNLHGSRGTDGQPGYFALDGKVGEDGKAKLSGNGIVASRAYARGVFAHKGESYTWDVKAEFKDTQGTGLRSEGLGIVGRACTFDFVKQ